jgi:hypothetical protein
VAGAGLTTLGAVAETAKNTAKNIGAGAATDAPPAAEQKQGFLDKAKEKLHMGGKKE